jgi:hypothetical protein
VIKVRRSFRTLCPRVCALLASRRRSVSVKRMRRPPKCCLSTVLFLEILDHVQLMAVDPPGEYHEQQLERLKRWERCSKYTG